MPCLVGCVSVPSEGGRCCRCSRPVAQPPQLEAGTPAQVSALDTGGFHENVAPIAAARRTQAGEVKALAQPKLPTGGPHSQPLQAPSLLALPLGNLGVPYRDSRWQAKPWTCRKPRASWLVPVVTGGVARTAAAVHTRVQQRCVAVTTRPLDIRHTKTSGPANLPNRRVRWTTPNTCRTAMV